MYAHNPFQQIAAGQGRKNSLSIMLLAGLLLIGICGCPFVGLAYEDDMVAGYAVVAGDSLDDTRIERRTGPNAGQIVGPMIFAYGWNDDFIVAKQHPVRDWPKVETSRTNWFIIEVGSGKVHGPLTEEQYIALRQTIGVPVGLTFTKYVGKTGGKAH
jgi:hypothetical protein